MASSNNASANSFTFLNYHDPKHNASHRKTVKSHISSKYRTAVRQQAQPRYALPRRIGPLPTSPDAAGDELVIATRVHKRDTDPYTPDSSPGMPWTPSPLEINFHGIRVDPFRSFPGQQTPCVTNALDYYTQEISPLMEPLLLAVHMVNPLMVWIYPLVLSDESSFHGAVALSQAYLEKRQDPSARLSSEVVFHRRKAVEILRDRLLDLKGPPDDGTLMTVLALACLDLVSGDDRVANRKGLALMVALKGGLDNLGLRGLVKAFLVQFDYFWMLETGSASLFPFRQRKHDRVYPRHPFSSEVQILIAALPSGIAAISRQGNIGVDVLQILSRVATFLRSKVANVKTKVEQELLEYTQGYPDIFDACMYLQSSASTEHSLEKNLLLAVILFSFDIHSPNGSMSKIGAYRGSRQELTRSLPSTPSRNLEERFCLIWIWMIVIRSWKVDHAVEDRGGSLGRQFFENFGEAVAWDVVEGAMRQFFWYEPLAESLRRSWREELQTFLAAEKPDWESTGPKVPLQELVHALPWHGRDLTEQVKESVGSTSSEDGSVRSTETIVLPPMLTLDTYLGQIQ